MSDLDIMEITDSDTTCGICYAEFLEPEDLAVHISQVHSESAQCTLVSCHFCTERLSDLAEYALHIRDHHLPNLRCCKFCNRVFQDADKFRKHESKHYTYVPKSMYSCSQCGKLFNNTMELELHERKDHANAEGVLLHDCLPLLSSLLNIKALKFLQSIDDEVIYTCVNCTLTTDNVNCYLLHLKAKNCQSPVCDRCSSVYRNRKNLTKHLTTHKGCYHNGQPKYKQCTECCKMFEIKMWSRHTKFCRPIKCRTCNIIYSTMNELADHQSKYHPLTVVLEACKYCHKEFAGVKAMEKHMERAHQRELHLYKYKCVHCDAIFKHPQKLFAHFSSTHKDIEPYTCKICDKKFKLRKRFTIHIKLDHKSIGYIEFDENYHVFFSDKKSEKPFRPIAESLTQNDDSVASEASQDAICGAQNEVEKEETAEVPSNAVEEANENINLNKDFMSATETEGNQTEVEQSEEKTQTRKRKRRTNLKNEKAESSDDEPLLEVKKRVIKLRKSKLTHATWNRKKQTELKVNKKRFICNICKKYCYTFQNYHNHVGTHYKNVTLKCVKCSKTFDSKEELNKHCSEEHSTSQLTETLKSLLEKRKKGQNPEGTTAEKFQRTIKNVDFPTDTVSVTLKPVNQNQSVKNFLESFTPEDAPKNTPSIEVVTSITMKPYVGECREPLIKMTKCNITPMDYTEKKLSMPVQFRQVFRETHKVTIKQVFPDPTPEPSQDYPETYDYESDDKNESIPEVAQEVMLEVSEEAPPKTLYIPHKIVLPNLPKEFNKVRIAHLQPEAPYYKIVKVEDVLNPQKKTKQPKPIPKPDIKLPDGTKLVTVNPLAHLLRGTPVEKILENTKSKYYQPKPKDVEMAIAKAMLKLENPNAFSKKRRKKCDVEK